MGWGTLAQVTDPIYSSKSFYGVNPEGANRGLIQVPGWETLSPGAAAQAVQGSAFPDEYDKWEPLATELVEGNQDVDPIS